MVSTPAITAEKVASLHVWHERQLGWHHGCDRVQTNKRSLPLHSRPFNVSRRGESFLLYYITPSDIRNRFLLRKKECAYMKSQPQDPHDKPSFAEQHLWRMRWLALIAFVLIFVCSLIIIAVTGNALFVPNPGALLIAMRPIIRFTFPNDKQEP